MTRAHFTYTAADLENLPTLSTSQADDLKIDDGNTRVWLCRCGVADGMPYDNQITIEELDSHGRWVVVATYEG